MAHFTSFAGLTELDNGDPITINGASFTNTDPNTVDRLLRVGAVTHRHDAHAPLPDPTGTPTVTVEDSGGQISSQQQVFAAYTLVDSDGGETMRSAPTLVTTGLQPDAPQASFDATFDSTGGSLPVGQYAYAVTLNDPTGGESTIGPATFVQRQPGFPSGQVQLSGLDAEVDGTVWVSWNLWRAQDGGDLQIIATGQSDSFTDTGLICTDASRTPPIDMTNVGSTFALSVTLPTAGDDPSIDDASSMNLYLSVDGSFSNPCLQGNYPVASGGVPFTVAQLVLQNGAPPPVSRSIPGAQLIDPDTDMLDFPWKRPVATLTALPTTGNEDGDVRLVKDQPALYEFTTASGGVWREITASGSVGGGGGGGAGTLAVVTDGAHTVDNPSTIHFHNATVHDDGSGVVSVTIPSGGGGGGGGGAASGIIAPVSTFADLPITADGHVDLVTDGFDDTNGTLLEAHTAGADDNDNPIVITWVKVDGPEMFISGSEVFVQASGISDYVCASMSPSTSDQYAEINVQIGASGTTYGGAWLRWDETTLSGYLAYQGRSASGGPITISRFDNGVETILVQVDGVGAAQDIIFVARGDVLSVYANNFDGQVGTGTLYAQATDGTYAGPGHVGLRGTYGGSGTAAAGFGYLVIGDYSQPVTAAPPDGTLAVTLDTYTAFAYQEAINGWVLPEPAQLNIFGQNDADPPTFNFLQHVNTINLDPSIVLDDNGGGEVTMKAVLPTDDLGITISENGLNSHPQTNGQFFSAEGVLVGANVGGVSDTNFVAAGAELVRPFISASGHTLQTIDRYHILMFENACVVMIPTQGGLLGDQLEMQGGEWIDLFQMGSGPVTFITDPDTSDGGFTLYMPADRTQGCRTQGSRIRLTCLGYNTFMVSGDLAS